MWTVKHLTAVDSKGNSITVEGKKITVVVKLDNGLRATKNFVRDRASPVIEVAIQDFVRQLCIDASNIN